MFMYEKQNALRLPFSPSSSSSQPFWKIGELGELGANKYFTEHQTANNIQLLRLLKRKSTFHWPDFPIFFFTTTFLEYREIRSKKYFTDHRTANKIQLLVPIKLNYSGLFFF